MKRTLLFLVPVALPLGCLAVPLAQGSEKLTLDHSVYPSWNTVTGTTLSARGDWIAYGLRPGDRGDGRLLLHGLADGGPEYAVERGRGARFDFDQTHAAFLVAPSRDALRQAKKDEIPEKKRPKDSLGLMDLSSGEVETVERVRSFALPEERGGFAAWLHLEPVEKKEKDKEEAEEGEAEEEPEQAEEPEEPAEEEEKKDKKKEKKRKDGTELVLRDLSSGAERRVDQVQSYAFSKDGRWLACITSSKDGSNDTVRVLEVGGEAETVILAGEGEHKSLSFSEDGAQLSFLSNRDDYQADQPRWSLYLWREGQAEAEAVATAGDAGLPEGWGVSEHRRPVFSEAGNRLFFGSAPLPEPEPEEPFDDEKVVVDVWSWTDDRIQPLQLEELNEDKERSYWSVVQLDRGRDLSVLEREEMTGVRMPDDRGSRYALGVSNRAYRAARQWDTNVPSDLYRIDIETGAVEPLLTGRLGNFDISPGGGFAAWWDGRERTWYALDLGGGQPVDLGANIPHPLHNELHDQPSLPRAHGSGGWLAGDARILIYDRFDVWSVNPRDGAATCLTDGRGRADEVRLRVVDLDRDEEALAVDAPLLLEAFDQRDKSSGFWRDHPVDQAEPTVLVMDACRFSRPVQASEGEALHFTRSTFEEFPDVWVSDADFADARRVSHANPQQADYRWGTAELVTWTSSEGEELEGILYKPEDFDPERKYPLLTYFYERLSDNLHRHWTPLPGRSSVSVPFYVSRGYLVFLPDIPYEVGFPGQSALRAIVPGVLNLVDQGFVDPDALGIQGHSWGGYQAAYMISQTDLFSAAVGGAVVSNMTSAYGGIRYASGLSRQFQYEKTQSRIGATLWEAPMRYIDNSPLFFADEVETPLLMMHNDDDGAVPWTQGIELFVALKRLAKPVWMLNYNGEPHGLTKYANQRDYAIRMQQFFDHYLLGAEAPPWMVEGVPAVDKGRDLGLGTEEATAVEASF